MSRQGESGQIVIYLVPWKPSLKSLHNAGLHCIKHDTVKCERTHTYKQHHEAIIVGICIVLTTNCENERLDTLLTSMMLLDNFGKRFGIFHQV